MQTATSESSYTGNAARFPGIVPLRLAPGLLCGCGVLAGSALGQVVDPGEFGPPAGSSSATVQQGYLKAFSVDARDNFGVGVAVSGGHLVVGAPAEEGGDSGTQGNPSDDSVNGAGAAYVFLRQGATWVPDAYLKASNVDRWQYFGSAVAVSGDTVVVGATGERSSATGVDGDQSSTELSSAGAAYVFVRDGAGWIQQAYLKASNTGEGDGFGWTVAISGDTIVVGAPGEDSGAPGVGGNQSDNSVFDAGAAYVFVRSGSSWVQQAYLKASAPGRDDEFARSLDISGDTIVVGAPFESSSAAGVDGDPDDDDRPNSGAAYVFVRRGGVWSQEAYLKAAVPDVNDIFGSAVAVAGDQVLVGAPGEDSRSTGIDGTPGNDTLDAGAAYVFERDGSTWTQAAYVKASNTDPRDGFGNAVAMTPGRFVVAAARENGGATGVNGDDADDSRPNSGAAYVFERDGASWRQRSYLKAFNTNGFDEFGRSVAISRETTVCGTPIEAGSGEPDDAPDNDLEPRSGAAYVFGPELCTPFCSSLPNATGAGAQLSCTGDPRSSFVLRSAPVPETVGQFLFGFASTNGSPFGDGLLCIAGPRRTLPDFVRAGSATQPPNTAVLAIDYGAPYAAGLVGTVHFQHWFRSGLTSGAGFNTSNGLTVTF